MMRKPSDRLAEPFKVPPDTMDGFYWNPLAGGLSLVPAAPPPGCYSESQIERLIERPADGAPCRFLVLVRTSFYETQDHYRMRRAHRIAARKSSKRRAKP